MRTLTFVVALAALFVIAHPGIAPAAGPAVTEGLVRVPSTNLDQLYLRPGIDLRLYTKVLLEPPTVQFRDDWVRDMNSARNTAQWIDGKDAQKIAADARTWLQDGLNETFAANGYEIVTAPESNTLRLSPKIVDFYVNAPDKVASGRSVTLTNEAGTATLILEGRDAVTNVPVLEITDHRTAMRIGGLTPSTSVTNQGDFSQLFTQWASTCVIAIKSAAASGAGL